MRAAHQYVLYLLRGQADVGSFPLAVALGAFFLTPTIGDIFGTITNIQWTAQFALIFAVLGPVGEQRSLIQNTFAIPLILIASLSGPFSVLQSVFILFLWSMPALEGRMGVTGGFVSPIKDIISGIDPARFAALLLGAVIQLVTMALSGVYTPNKTYEITVQEYEQFHFSGFSAYGAAVHHPFNRSNLLLLAAYILVLIFKAIATIRCFSTKNVSHTLLLLIGAVQPIMAYAKQRQPDMLLPVSHY